MIAYYCDHLVEFYDTIKATVWTASKYIFKDAMSTAIDEFEDYKRVAREAAYRYLTMGWSIIPIRFSDKRPAIEWRHLQERQPTEEEVDSWFDDGVPDGNGGMITAFGIGVITGAISGLVVCDCDNQDAITYAINELGLFSLMNVSTTRGQHMYFKHPGSERIQNKVGGQGVDWPDVAGLDLRGDGGYVVAPPSMKFGKDDKLQHIYRFNCPTEEIENFASTLPVWPGVRLRSADKTITDINDWTFENLSLASVRSYGADVWEQTRLRTVTIGRKMRDGDGRNAWLVRYLGECISSGMEEEQAKEASAQYQGEFFDPVLPSDEGLTVLRSVISTDKRNHPDKYEKKAAYDNANPVRKGRAAAIRLITPKNLAELKRKAGGSKWLIEPFVPPASIIQVVGFNGHGKSLWLLNLLWCAARGHSFGSGHITKKVKALYCDFEGSTNVLVDRIESCVAQHGDMDDSLTIWNANAADDPMPLGEEGAMNRLAAIISEVEPQLVVIDTVRQAWSGMEENSPHSWVKVNDLAMTCRNAGMSVILVHHRNKPNMQGHGREAGSTAQLKDLDVQIIVTKVVVDMDQAKREAAMPDSATLVADSSGATTTAWSYLQRMLNPGELMKFVFEISFGKVRQATENHVTTYIGMAQNTTDGQWRTVSSLTPLQKALAYSARGVSVDEIATKIGVSQPTINGWLVNSKGTK